MVAWCSSDSPYRKVGSGGGERKLGVFLAGCAFLKAMVVQVVFFLPHTSPLSRKPAASAAWSSACPPGGDLGERAEEVLGEEPDHARGHRGHMAMGDD